jgi:hypothetical protein
VGDFTVASDAGGGNPKLGAGGGPAACGSTAVPTGSSGPGCTPVGVTSCPAGASLDRSGGCAALLPHEPCGPGKVELLGATSCANRWQCPGGDYPVVPLGIDPGSAQYVNRNFSGKSDGTRSNPWTTITDALATVKANGAVLVAAGSYAEDLVLDKPGVHLIGSCPDRVSITGSGAVVTPPALYPCAYSGPKAALCIAASAASSVVQALEVKGGGDGVAVVGATGVKLSLLQVVGTGRYGIRIEELGRPDGSLAAAGATLDDLSVQGAHGAGIYVGGATVNTVSQVTISATQPLNDYRGYGMTVLPGATGLGSRTSSDVKLAGLLIVGSADAALHVSGSTATVTDSFLGNLDGVAPAGRGVLVERTMFPGGNQAHVTLKRTIVQRTRDAAIDVRSSAVSLEDVTVRDTFGRSPDGCSGQGIRIRADRHAPATATVTHSLIDQSRQAAIHALGAAVTVTGSILRGSAPDSTTAAACALHLGDGITLEPLPAPGDPTALTLDHSLVVFNARAALANFGGSVTARSSVLSCGLQQHGLVDRADAGGGSEGLLCTCGESLVTCDVERTPLERWISPGAASGHKGSTEDWSVNVQHAFTNQQLADGVALMLDFPEVAPAFPDAGGCATLSGVPRDVGDRFDNRRVAVWGEGTVAALRQVPPTVIPSCGPLAVSAVGVGTGSGIGVGDLSLAKLFETGEPIDSNRGYLYVGLVSQQSPESGTPWSSNAGGGPIVRYNVDPGWYAFLANTAPLSGGIAQIPISGLPVPGARTVRVLVEGGMIGNLLPQGTIAQPGPCEASPGTTGFPDPAGLCLAGGPAQEACSAYVAASYPPTCATCLCTSCLNGWSACAGDPGCRQIVACMVKTGCHGPACGAACAAEFAAAGGQSSSSGMIAYGVDACDVGAGCTACGLPPPDAAAAAAQ